jgi:tellurite methyltransferase
MNRASNDIRNSPHREAFMSADDGWDVYYTATEGRPPHDLLVRAVSLLEPPGRALDLGAGAGNDTRFLLARGFHVTAVDADPAAIRRLRTIGDDRLTVVQATFEEFDFGSDRYDLISAQLALPFLERASFNAVFARLLAALAPGGLFCGDLWGERDDWNTPESGLSFLPREEVMRLLEGYEIVEMQEDESSVDLVDGGTRHAHAFDIIARRRA